MIGVYLKRGDIMTTEDLAHMFDHTFLKPYATKDDFKKLCNEAKSMGAAMVAINSEPVRLCKELLKATCYKIKLKEPLN